MTYLSFSFSPSLAPSPSLSVPYPFIHPLCERPGNPNHKHRGCRVMRPVSCVSCVWCIVYRVFNSGWAHAHAHAHPISHPIFGYLPWWPEAEALGAVSVTVSLSGPGSGFKVQGSRFPLLLLLLLLAIPCLLLLAHYGTWWTAGRPGRAPWAVR